ncbi:unnamed protein product [Sympodiomycopsis kandeliae]
MILGGRFVAGLGVGMLSLLVPVYQSEIAHPSIRGSLTTLQQLFVGLGNLLASCVIFGMTRNYQDTPFQWRFPLALQLLPAVPLVLLIFAFPESPRWLVAVGKESEALRSLARLHAQGDVNDTFVAAELLQLRQKDAEIKLHQKSWAQTLVDYQSMRKILLAISLQFAVQMTGVSAIQYYSPQIFESFGFDYTETFRFQIIAAVFAIVGEVLAVVLVDRTGRRWPLIICHAGCGATFVVASAISARVPLAQAKLHRGPSYAFVVFTWLFQFFFSSGVGPLAWVIPSEMLNTAIRAQGVALANMATWIANFMIGQVTPKAINDVGWKYYLLFAIAGFTNAAFFWLFLPETVGKTLEEMDAFFEATPLIVPGSAGTRRTSTEANMVQEYGHHGNLYVWDPQRKRVPAVVAEIRDA